MDAWEVGGVKPGGLPGCWGQERLTGDMSEKPAGGEHRVGSREEPGVSRQLLQKVCGKEHGWPAGACELLLRDIQPIISSDPGACIPKQVWSGHREA